MARRYQGTWTGADRAPLPVCADRESYRTSWANAIAGLAFARLIAILRRFKSAAKPTCALAIKPDPRSDEPIRRQEISTPAKGGRGTIRTTPSALQALLYRRLKGTSSERARVPRGVRSALSPRSPPSSWNRSGADGARASTAKRNCVESSPPMKRATGSAGHLAQTDNARLRRQILPALNDHTAHGGIA
jgi:hypothetical protein